MIVDQGEMEVEVCLTCRVRYRVYDEGSIRVDAVSPLALEGIELDFEQLPEHERKCLEAAIERRREFEAKTAGL